MFDGDFYCEVANERIEQRLKAAEHDALVKQVRLARRSSSSSGLRNGLVARSAALLMTLFKTPNYRSA